MKMDRLVVKTVAVIAVVWFVVPARAVDPNRMISQYMHERWGIEKGFSGGSVTSIAQTPDGYLCIGTEKGLIRFDGLRFRVFQQATPASFPIGPVQALMTDGQGNLWIVLQNTKILRYQDGKFELGHDEAEAGISSLARRTDGTMLFSSLALGALAYSDGKFEILHPSAELASHARADFPASNDNLASRLSWATGVTEHRLADPNSPVISMAATDDGKIWLGTQDKGLFYLKDGTISGVSKPSSEEKINCLLALKNGQLWVGTAQGVLLWNGSALTRDGVPPALAHAETLSMSLDRDLNVWLGTPRGLLRYNTQSVPAQVDFRPPGAVTAIFEDREGDLWIGTSGAIERYRDSPFTTYTA